MTELVAQVDPGAYEEQSISGFSDAIINLTSQQNGTEQMLDFKRELLDSFAKTAQSFIRTANASTHGDKVARLLQKIGIVLSLKGVFECEAYLHHLDEVKSRLAEQPGNYPQDNQNIDQQMNSIRAILDGCKWVAGSADKLLADDMHVFGKECIALAKSDFLIECQIDELLHSLIKEYNGETKKMNSKPATLQHRRLVAKAFLLIDPSTELELGPLQPTFQDHGFPAEPNYTFTEEGIEPSDQLVEKLQRKLNSILLFNNY